MKHIPVLLNSVLDTLGDIHNKTIIDCTFGAGGYSKAFLERGAKVIAFDRDYSVKKDADLLQKQYENKFTFINDKFSAISNIDTFDDVVFDLGISSMQIDTPERGFSFRFDAPLDMRMNTTDKMSVADMICNISEQNLADILYRYGDIKQSLRLAKIIKKAQPKTTFQLKDLIKNPKDIAPVFQALRIYVNDEFGEIQKALDVVHDKLHTGGRCICVTFHSLEDRLVKNTFKQWSNVAGDPRLPIVMQPQYKLLKTFVPSESEVIENPRARSAHLRAIEKI